jgi:hypothetical protein
LQKRDLQFGSVRVYAIRSNAKPHRVDGGGKEDLLRRVFQWLHDSRDNPRSALVLARDGCQVLAMSSIDRSLPSVRMWGHGKPDQQAATGNWVRLLSLSALRAGPGRRRRRSRWATRSGQDARRLCLRHRALVLGGHRQLKNGDGYPEIFPGVGDPTPGSEIGRWRRPLQRKSGIRLSKGDPRPPGHEAISPLTKKRMPSPLGLISAYVSP